MINYGLRNNVPSNTLYNSQIGSVIFCCGIVFKISSLPGIVSENMHSSTLWAYMLMSAFELLCMLSIYTFFRFKVDSFLTDLNSKSYKLILFFMMLYLILKNVIYFSFVSLFLTRELFVGVAPVLFIVIFLIPVFYLGIKGLRTIARTTEILVLILFASLMVNLIFLKADMDIGRNMPILAMEPSEFFINTIKYGFWLGDLMPLIFVKMQKKKLPYIGISVFFAFALVLISVFLGVALYGEALNFVANLLVEFAAFNQLSLEIGRLEWIALFAVITMSIFTLALQFWGITACSERIFKSKKPLQIAYPIIIIAILTSVPSLQHIVNFASSWAGYVFFAFAVLTPLLLLALAAFHKHRRPLQFKKLMCENNAFDTGTPISTAALDLESKKPSITQPSPIAEEGGTDTDESAKDADDTSGQTNNVSAANNSAGNGGAI